jgi:hypothetical protein
MPPQIQYADMAFWKKESGRTWYLYLESSFVVDSDDHRLAREDLSCYCGICQVLLRLNSDTLDPIWDEIETDVRHGRFQVFESPLDVLCWRALSCTP